MNIRVAMVTEVTPALVAAFERLLPQLSPNAAKLGAPELGEIVASSATTLLVAHDGSEDAIVGAITLVVFRIPSARCARIESLVVDAAARGRGVGEALCRAAVRRATELGAEIVDLTSSPSRGAANRLYARLGFETRATNVYRFRTCARA